MEIYKVLPALLARFEITVVYPGKEWKILPRFFRPHDRLRGPVDDSDKVLRVHVSIPRQCFGPIWQFGEIPPLFPDVTAKISTMLRIDNRVGIRVSITASV
jgi:hypothetical protein